MYTDLFPPWLLTSFAIAIGATMGSFANVVIYRLPLGKSILRPRSHCPTCEAPIAWYDNIPVLSFLFLAGRCRRCNTAISLRYPLIELSLAVLSLACLYDGMLRAQGLMLGALWFFSFSFCFLLVVITFIDLEHWRIPPVLTITGIVLGLLGAMSVGGLTGTKVTDSLIGLAVGGLGLALIAELYRILAKRDGMGYGDVFLLGMIGAQLGWKSIPGVLLLASVQGLVISIPLALTGRVKTPPWHDGTSEKRLLLSPVPFGPFLTLGALEWMFFGDKLVDLLFT